MGGGIDPVGLACAGVAVLAFGSNFIVAKKYETGDGVFFSWVMSVAILITGMITQCVECYTEKDDGSTACPAFEPFAMLGGAIWATGNLMVVPIVKTVGLGLGMCVWGSVNMLIGWGQGKFGLFGLKADEISSPGLNYVGVCLTTVAIVVFMFIKPTLTKPGAGGKKLSDSGDEESSENLIAYEKEEGEEVGEGAEAADGEGSSWIDRMPVGVRRLFGICTAVASGCFYGLNFTPPSYIAQRAGTPAYPNASSNLVDYVFPHFCGIFAATTVYMLIYAALKKNKPVLFPEIVIPGFISGSVWSIAQVSWFVANARLSLSIAFPLIAAGPGLVGALWGAAVFKEIQGRQNFMYLGAAFVLVISSAVTISLSK